METNHSNDPGASHVPEQQNGTEMNAVERVELASIADAIDFFKIVKERLLDVNQWTKIAGTKMSNFYLTDSSGHQVSRSAINGDHIKIDIPGPGTTTGKGYDWVRIEQIITEELDDAEVLSVTVRPSANPLNDKEGTAHFLTEEATSTFQVKRIGNIVSAEEHGRNEMPNTRTDKALDNIRNVFVGWGAKIGLSYPQWKALVKGLLTIRA